MRADEHVRVRGSSSAESDVPFDRDIVDVVIGDILFLPDDVDGVTHSRAMEPFISTLEDDEDGPSNSSVGASQQKIVIKNPLQYCLAVGHLSTYFHNGTLSSVKILFLNS